MTRANHIKFLAAFLVAFVCLNAAGAFCIAYCQGSDTFENADKNELDHCSKAPVSPDQDLVSVSAQKIDCCPMTVSFIAGPIEKRLEPSHIELAENSPVEYFVWHFSSQVRNPRTFNYRGPPFDRRGDRIKYRVLRI